MSGSEVERVAKAIRVAALAQGMILDGLNLRALATAAIEATDHALEVKGIFESAAKSIEDYDRREAAGEDVSGEDRPRMPGGSDW